MKTKTRTAMLAAAALTLLATEAVAETWSFDDDQADTAPRGFSFARTGGGALGRWRVVAATDSPSGKQVLAQLDADDTDDRFPVAVADSPVLADVRVTVKCKMIAGKVDRACGLVVRYVDENNYYLTRANALEGNVRLYHVKEGKRRQLASWRGQVTSGVWHEYRVEVVGDRIRISWDGKQVLETKDRTFAAPGRAGVWTKADSITEFDDLVVEEAKP